MRDALWIVFIVLPLITHCVMMLFASWNDVLCVMHLCAFVTRFAVVFYFSVNASVYHLQVVAIVMSIYANQIP